MSGGDTLHQEATASRLLAGELRMNRMEQDIAAIRETHQQLHTALRANTELTQSVKDAVETWQTVSKVSTWIGTAARWLAGVGAAIFAFWQLVTKWKGH